MRGPDIPSTPVSALGPVLLVLIGGAVGTLVRAVLEDTFAAGPGEWPWTTFAINVSGSFLLGALVSALAVRGDDSGGRRRVRLAVGTGVLGGFTTYSTFIVEVDELLRDGALGLGAAYALGSVVAGVLAAGLGVLLGGARTTSVDPDEAGR
ncbi:MULTISPECIES: CrcB family protein [Aeromicrobium]|uniref:fluoride efflux transporter FluC n=1 Tax=Aeromicrobium TaxID=2040 RepID=UPI00210CDE5E|nr:CrcB family protein [Aeromicrobium sp. 636]